MTDRAEKLETEEMEPVLLLCATNGCGVCGQARAGAPINSWMWEVPDMHRREVLVAGHPEAPFEGELSMFSVKEQLRMYALDQAVRLYVSIPIPGQGAAREDDIVTIAERFDKFLQGET